jgi:hypothetical protein
MRDGISFFLLDHGDAKGINKRLGHATDMFWRITDVDYSR